MVNSAFIPREIFEQLCALVHEIDESGENIVQIMLDSIPSLLAGESIEANQQMEEVDSLQARLFGTLRDNYRDVLADVGLTLLQLPRFVPVMVAPMRVMVMLKCQETMIDIVDGDRFEQLLSGVSPESVGGDSSPVNQLLQRIASSVRQVLSTRDFANPGEEEFGFLIGVLPKLAPAYQRLGMHRWSSYFEELERAKQGRFLREFLLLEPFGPNAWVTTPVEHWFDTLPYSDTVYGWDKASKSLIEAERNPQARQLVNSVSTYMARVADGALPVDAVHFPRSEDNQLGVDILSAAYETIRDISSRTIG
jgi:hypothetical protein